MVEDIVVTARRRDEQLKDVPVAVSALSAERLEQTGATNITALQQQTPNATVQIARGSNSTLISFIRGVGQQDPLWGFEPGVGLYVDDVYVARPQGAVLDIFDISRIEVLRGPQGTLYGRNTIGGAIKYVTKRLGDDPSLTARAEVGAYNEHNFLLSGSVPVGETFAIGGAVATYQHDGYGKNLNTGQDQYDKDVTAYRASAEWTPNDSLFFRLAWDRVEDDSSPRHGHREVNSTTGGYTPPAGEYDTYAGITGEQKVVTEGVALTGEYRVNDMLTLKSITAYRSGDTATIIDFDQTPLPTLDVPAIYSDDQFTQEFQALFTGDRWSGVAGVYLSGRHLVGRLRHHRRQSGPGHRGGRVGGHQVLLGVRRLQLRPDRSPAPLAGRPLHQATTRTPRSCASSIWAPRRRPLPAARRATDLRDAHQLHGFGHLREVHAARQHLV
jgi:iron complex outermembrane recepter protein